MASGSTASSPRRCRFSTMLSPAPESRFPSRLCARERCNIIWTMPALPYQVPKPWAASDGSCSISRNVSIGACLVPVRKRDAVFCAGQPVPQLHVCERYAVFSVGEPVSQPPVCEGDRVLSLERGLIRLLRGQHSLLVGGGCLHVTDAWGFRV